MCRYNVTVPVGFRASITVPAQCGGVPLVRVAEGLDAREGGDGGVDVWVSGTESSADARGTTVDGVSVRACDVRSGDGAVRPACRNDVLEVELTSGVFRVVASYNH
jgi:hypothetical protein